MQLNTSKINQILWILALIILIGGGIWCIFLNEAQRIVVGIGILLALLNLLGVRYFINKNMRPRR